MTDPSALHISAHQIRMIYVDATSLLLWQVKLAAVATVHHTYLMSGKSQGPCQLQAAVADCNGESKMLVMCRSQCLGQGQAPLSLTPLRGPSLAPQYPKTTP